VDRERGLGVDRLRAALASHHGLARHPEPRRKRGLSQAALKAVVFVL